jgi:hypothetical protein
MDYLHRAGNLETVTGLSGGHWGGWYVAGTLAAPPCPGSPTALRAGQFKMVPLAVNWRDLLVGGIRLGIDRPRPPTGCPTS